MSKINITKIAFSTIKSPVKKQYVLDQMIESGWRLSDGLLTAPIGWFGCDELPIDLAISIFLDDQELKRMEKKYMAAGGRKCNGWDDWN